MTEPGVRAEFEERGIVRLAGVFSDAAAATMRDIVWEAWRARDGMVPDDRRTWPTTTIWKTPREAKKHPAFRTILGPPLVALADELLGPGWTTSSGFGNLLASLPDGEVWRLPGRGALWHSDFGYRTPMEPLPGLRVFAVFGDTPPGGGGTLLVAGSHRMVADFVARAPDQASARAKEARAACHRSNPWLHELTSGDECEDGRPERFMGAPTDVDGIPAQVVEACGRPGEVFVCHPWTIHCRPPNAADRPRFLRSPTLSRAG